MSTHESTRADFFEVGDKTSLICADPTVGDVVRAALKELGYKAHVAETGETAIERIRYTQYDCIVIQEDFAGSSLRSNTVLNYLAPLPMAQRRYSFVCVIGPSFKTLDAMQSFTQSVHLVVSPGDLTNFTAILKKGLTEFEDVYRVYKETVAAQGVK